MVLSIMATVCYSRWRLPEHPLTMIAAEVGNHGCWAIHVHSASFQYEVGPESCGPKIKVNKRGVGGKQTNMNWISTTTKGLE